jgi:glycosyl transferase family 25
MNNFVINLDRSRDRLARMKRIFEAIDLGFERFAACDFSKSAIEFPYNKIRKRKMIAGEFGAMMSHLQLYKNLLNSLSDYFVIFEDDVIVSSELKSFIDLLKYDKEIFNRFDILKLEAFYSMAQVDTRTSYNLGNVEFLHLISTHKGAAGYVVSRRAAQKLITLIESFPIVCDYIFVDHIMRDHDIRVGQAFPALVVQDKKAALFGVTADDVEQTFIRPKKKISHSKKSIRDRFDHVIDQIRVFKDKMYTYYQKIKNIRHWEKREIYFLDLSKN